MEDTTRSFNGGRKKKLHSELQIRPALGGVRRSTVRHAGLIVCRACRQSDKAAPQQSCPLRNRSQRQYAREIDHLSPRPDGRRERLCRSHCSIEL